MPAAPTATPDEIKDVNTRYHDAAAGRVRRQVGDRLRRRSARTRCARSCVKALGRDARAAVRRRARDRRRHRLLLAQPAPARADRARDRHRHLAGDARDACGERRRALGLEVETVCTEAERAAVRRRELRPRLRPRDPPPHPRPRARLLGVPPRPAPRRHARLLRRALALRRPDRGAAEARRAPRGARLAAAGRRLGARPGSTGRRDDGHELESEVDVHAFAPAAAARPRRRRRASATSGCAARSWSPTPTAGCCARSRRPPSRTRCPFAWRHFAYRSYIALQRLDTGAARAAAAARALLQPRAQRPQARLSAAHWSSMFP